MSGEKQIDTPTNTPTQNQFTNSELKELGELARAMCDVCRTTDDNQCEDMHCEGVMKHAEKLYKQGIRKQREGEWVLVQDKSAYGDNYFICSVCEGKSHSNKFGYCPNCGAKMGGGADK